MAVDQEVVPAPPPNGPATLHAYERRSYTKYRLYVKENPKHASEITSEVWKEYFPEYEQALMEYHWDFYEWYRIQKDFESQNHR